MSCTISRENGLQTIGKDQRSDGLTYKLLGVFIHRNTKHSMRIMGSEDGLNNYFGEGDTRIN